MKDWEMTVIQSPEKVAWLNDGLYTIYSQGYMQTPDDEWLYVILYTNPLGKYMADILPVPEPLTEAGLLPSESTDGDGCCGGVCDIPSDTA